MSTPLDQRLQSKVEAGLADWRNTMKRALAGLSQRDRRIRQLEAEVAVLRETIEAQKGRPLT